MSFSVFSIPIISGRRGKAVCRLLTVWIAVVAGAPSHEARAAVAQQVQSGTAVNSANGTQVITIAGVDPAKSFLIFETRSSSNRPVGSTVRGRIPTACANPCTTIEFVRVTNGVAPEPAPIDIQWYVVTFGSGVNVRRGEVALSASPVNVAIAAVAAVNRAFVLWSQTVDAADNTTDNSDALVGELTSTTNLQFRTNSFFATNMVAWQVVEFTNAADINVQKGTMTNPMTGTTTSVTATIPTPVNVGKTFVLIGWQTSGTGTDIGARMLRAQLTNSTTITIDRSISGTPDDITEIVWQAIELKDASTVWSGTANFPSGTAQVTVPLDPPANTTRAVAFMSSQGGGGQSMGRTPYAGDDIPGVASATASLGIVFRAAASANGPTVATLTINKPAGTAEHDVMVASIGLRTTTVVVTPPSGWTLVRQTQNAGPVANSLDVYYKVATDTEPANYAWTFSANVDSAGGIMSFSGADTGSPIWDVENGQATASALTHAAPSVTTRVANTMVVTFHTMANTATWTPPTGMTEAFDLASGGGSPQSIEGNYVFQTAAAATGVMTATASANAAAGNTQTIALRPASGAEWLTLTRSNTVDTADVGWFVVQFAQGSSPIKVGSFIKPLATGLQTIPHGLGEKPKALILWTDYFGPAETFGAGYGFGFGMTDGTTSRTVSATNQDAQGTSNNASRMANAVLTIVDPTSTNAAPLDQASFSSWDDTNIILNWTTTLNLSPAPVIHYIVIGGSDVQAKVVDWLMPTAVNASYPITGVGFQPNLVLHAHAGYQFNGALGTNLAGAHFGLGAMDGDGHQWAVTQYALDNAGNADTQRGQQTNGTIYSFNNALAVQKKASFVSMDADGFKLNFSNATSNVASRVFSLALKGVNGQVGSFNKNNNAGSNVSQPIAGLNFQPSAVLLTSFQNVTQAAPVAHGRFGIGAFDATTAGSSAISDENGPTTTNIDAIDKTSKAFVKVNNATAAIDAEASLTSLDTDGFTLNWTTNDAVATEMLYLAFAPANVTEVRLVSFNATRYNRGVLLQWRTGYEIDNLGFNLYRDVNGVRTRVNGSLIAGSGLMAGQGTAVNATQAYAAWDLVAAPTAGDVVMYWLEDLDFAGTRTMHGPITPSLGVLDAPMPNVAQSSDLNEISRFSRFRQVFLEHGEAEADPNRRAWIIQPLSQTQTQWTLAGQPAVKIGVRAPGWYRVAQADLIAAGLNPLLDPLRLQLFVYGVEQAIRVTGEVDGHFDAGDAIEFYATGVDTSYTNTQVFWLTAGLELGKRIPVTGTTGSAASGATSFWLTAHRKDRSVFFAALRNGDKENWFGPLVSAAPTELTIVADNIDRAAGSAQLEVTLQGVTSTPDGSLDHTIGVLVNGTDVGEMAFRGQANVVHTFAVPASVLVDGENTVTLIARGGDADYSLVDVIRLSYWHLYRADADLLRFTLNEAGPVTIGGFASPAIRVVDITDPSAITELAGTVQSEADGFSSVTVLAQGQGPRTLLAFSDATIGTPASVEPNRPSNWHWRTQAHNWVAIAHRDFVAQAAPLANLREQQGYRAAVIDVEDLYDEFSFGEKTPQALRDFLQFAKTNWREAPQFVVLVGDATLDPRDYAQLGNADFVPTKQVPMSQVQLETASDDWFVDFNDDGLPEIPIGRLSVRSAVQADAMVAKIVNYNETSQDAWTKNVMLVADQNGDTINFERSSTDLQALLPAPYTAQQVFRGVLGDELAHQSLINGVNDGQLIVNYIGHGSSQIWGSNGELLTDGDALSLLNGARLPFVVAMNCLNGLFNAIWDEESLAEGWLRAPGGGAIAAWASSSVTPASTQAQVNRELFRLIFQGTYGTLGEAIVAAKRVVSSQDLRRSWIFFGDPAMRLSGTPLPDVARSPASPPPVIILPRDPNDVKRLTVTISGHGSVTVLPAGITCPLGTCSADFSSGAAVQLIAAPANGSTFTGWTGACSGGVESCSLTLSTAASVSATFTFIPGQRAELATPAPGSTLTASTIQFQWTGGTSVSQYWLEVGAAEGRHDFYNQGLTSLSATASSLPTNGSLVYVRLWSLINEVWQWNDYQYTASLTTPSKAQLTVPAPSSTLTSSTVTFEWTGGTSVSQYWLEVGAAEGRHDFYNQGLTSLSATASSLPTNGSLVYVRLWSLINGAWQWNDYRYTASSATTAPAQLTAPAPSSTLTSSTVTFQWTGGTGASQYRLEVGMTAGGSDVYGADLGTSLSATVSNLPTNGSTIFVRLLSMISGAWQGIDYTYTATNGSSGTPAKAQLTTPAPSSTLTSSTVTFQWTGGTSVSQYWLEVGTAEGRHDFYNQGLTTLSGTALSLPTNGSTVYVRLWSMINGAWQWNDYRYTASSITLAKAQLTTPPPSSTLTSSTVTFQWTGGTGVSQYWLEVAASQGAHDFYNQGLTSLNATVSGLPTNGSTVYVRLWSMINGAWQWNDYQYIASSTTPSEAQLTMPAPSSTLTSSTVTFEWTGGTGVSQYWLEVGATEGMHDFYNQGLTSLNATALGLPTDGSRVYVRLWSMINGAWRYKDYTYAAAH